MSCTADRRISKLFTIFIVLLRKFDSNYNSKSKIDRFKFRNIGSNGPFSLPMYCALLIAILELIFLCFSDSEGFSHN